MDVRRITFDPANQTTSYITDNITAQDINQWTYDDLNQNPKTDPIAHQGPVTIGTPTVSDPGLTIQDGNLVMNSDNTFVQILAPLDHAVRIGQHPSNTVGLTSFNLGQNNVVASDLSSVSGQNNFLGTGSNSSIISGNQNRTWIGDLSNRTDYTPNQNMAYTSGDNNWIARNNTSGANDVFQEGWRNTTLLTSNRNSQSINQKGEWNTVYATDTQQVPETRLIDNSLTPILIGPNVCEVIDQIGSDNIVNTFGLVNTTGFAGVKCSKQIGSANTITCAEDCYAFSVQQIGDNNNTDVTTGGVFASTSIGIANTISALSGTSSGIILLGNSNAFTNSATTTTGCNLIGNGNQLQFEAATLPVVNNNVFGSLNSIAILEPGQANNCALFGINNNINTTNMNIFLSGLFGSNNRITALGNDPPTYTLRNAYALGGSNTVILNDPILPGDRIDDIVLYGNVLEARCSQNYMTGYQGVVVNHPAGLENLPLWTFCSGIDVSTPTSLNRGIGFSIQALDASANPNVAVNFTGTLNGNPADYAHMIEWDAETLKTLEDPVGYFVNLRAGKLIIAKNLAQVQGVTSSQPGMILNNPDHWSKSFMTDDFGRALTKLVAKEPVEAKLEPIFLPTKILNPDYDQNLKYVTRQERKEWSAVSDSGFVWIRRENTDPINIGDLVSCSENGKAILVANDQIQLGYHVMDVKETTVLINYKTDVHATAKTLELLKGVRI